MNLRIAIPEIGRETFHFFTKNLSDKLKWDLSKIVNPNYFLPRDNQLWTTKTIADVEYIPELAKHIRELELTFGNKFKIARQEDAELFGRNVALDVNLLVYLDKLVFTGLVKDAHDRPPNIMRRGDAALNQAGHGQFFMALCLPNLQWLCIASVRGIQAYAIALAIGPHSAACLRWITLKNITLMDDQKDLLKRPGWVQLLRAAKEDLHEDATLGIVEPYVQKPDGGRFRVSFAPSEKDVAGRDIGLYPRENIRGDRWLGYVSRSDHLHSSLDYLILRYKELTSQEELEEHDVAWRRVKKNSEKWKTS